MNIISEHKGEIVYDGNCDYENIVYPTDGMWAIKNPNQTILDYYDESQVVIEKGIKYILSPEAKAIDDNTHYMCNIL